MNIHCPKRCADWQRTGHWPQTADLPIITGTVGAGTGATVGKHFGIERAMKGGIGAASATVDGITLGAIVPVDAVGDVVGPATGRVIAGMRDPVASKPRSATAAMLSGERPPFMATGTATAIGVLGTDAVLTKTQCRRPAGARHDGLARTIDPIHTLWNGDTIFAFAMGRSGKAGDMMLLGAVAARVMLATVLNAVRAAKAVGPIPLGISEID
ncbi:P1 family peptidase [Sabulicella rubraurantiaca]|uniref:P1 family peptidase n=1 Tax=Sabulicella rubraurantiaca TaxID=2811429 RepID=UPI001A95FA28|nr:P1 family peptidase [Sabulicella rubraurantiaca]